MGGGQKFPCKEKKGSRYAIFILWNTDLISVSDLCLFVCMFVEREWEGFCNILSGVGGSEWGLCSIVGPAGRDN